MNTIANVKAPKRKSQTNKHANKHYKPLNVVKITKNISKDKSKIKRCSSNELEQHISEGNTLKSSHSSNNVNGSENKNNTNSKESDEDLFEQDEDNFFTYLDFYTQFLEQLEKYESNSLPKIKNSISKSVLSQIDPCSTKQDANRKKRKSFEKTDCVYKVLKTDSETVGSADKSKDDFWNGTVDICSTQLFKTSQHQAQEYGPFFGLPTKVNELIQHYKGIERLYDWQEKCLNLPAIKNHSNLVYALPITAGKTLVAEILMLREIICRRKNVIFVLPYATRVQEKVWALSPFGVALDFLIEEYTADKGMYPPKKRRYKNSMYIVTTEKALGLFDSLIETGRLDEIGLVVVDKLHLVGEPGAGPTLETFLTKIMYINEMKHTEDIQIVGISTIIGNLSDICTFLKADLYKSDFRPVKLIEYVKVGDEIAKIHWDKRDNEFLQVVRKENYSYSKLLKEIDPERLGGLSLEVVPHDSCLIFCSSNKNCQNVAHLLCQVAFATLREHKKKEKNDLITALKSEGNNNICEILRVSIKHGIAYYHSGLLSEERRLLEDAFGEGVISVICCTLAAGVNLPAKRVILAEPYIDGEFINLSHYKQMVGHAGRVGFREVGESILVCTKEDLSKVRKLLQLPMDIALSNMHACEGKGLRQLFLSCVRFGTATNRRQLWQIASKSLLAVQQDKLNVNVKNLTYNVISSLFTLGALRTYIHEQRTSLTSTTSSNISLRTAALTEMNGSKKENTLETHSQEKPKTILTSNTKLIVSELGKAAIKGCLELSDAHLLYNDLTKAQKKLVRVDYLHLLYLITSYEQCEQIKPSKCLYYNLLIGLEQSEKQTAKILGIAKPCIIELYTNQQIKVQNIHFNKIDIY
ncbi:helicase POLQ-like isoform X1 [Agrilus planipennis]|uniref:Helicase POLQ-like isoform X1 n=1 Tax=Agrilus planipennis TaxID=224129 RepID=A0A1W4XGS2_AGRPL|nr:helicase POLQ-like isoform X1 [Agrilus planipennis]